MFFVLVHKDTNAQIFILQIFSNILILQDILSLLLSWSVFKFWLFIPVLRLPTEVWAFSTLEPKFTLGTALLPQSCTLRKQYVIQETPNSQPSETTTESGQAIHSLSKFLSTKFLFSLN